MLLKNIDSERGLVNGARGVVVGFAPAASDRSCGSVIPIVEFCGPDGGYSAPVRIEVEPDEWTVEASGRVIASRRQVGGLCARIQANPIPHRLCAHAHGRCH